jgi:sulfite exporter TauE/SafE
METTFSWIILALALGSLHALDADHIVTVSALAAQKSGLKAAIIYASRWAIGHAVALIAIGLPVLLLGMAIPKTLSQASETVVGLLIVFLGIHVLWSLRQKNTPMKLHAHGSVSTPAHWYHHHAHNNHPQHDHRPLMIGILHGMAGSSPLLALLPAFRLGSPWTGLLYLLLFSSGVWISMLVFGAFLGNLFHFLEQQGWVKTIRTIIGLLALLIGGKMVLAL